MAEQEGRIEFKAEDTLWEMLESGQRTFDLRRWDLSDLRIRRLATSLWRQSPSGALPHWEPTETLVSFRNKATTQLLTFRFVELKFTPWAPGWVFLILGDLVSRGG